MVDRGSRWTHRVAAAVDVVSAILLPCHPRRSDVVPQAAPKTSASKVTFVVRNTGKLLHEFVVLRTAKPAGLLAARNAPEAPEAGAVGEIGGVKPGATKRVTLSLAKGHYSLICNLPGHYSQGQFADFYVR